MFWKNLRKSSNVKDRREPGKTSTVFKAGAVSLSSAAVAAVWFAVSPYLTEDVKQQVGDPQHQQMKRENFSPEEHRDFVQAMVGVTEDVWSRLLQENRLYWKKADTVLFTDSVKTACGKADFEVGPFYCPADNTIYIDLDFMKVLDFNMGAMGDAVQAYVIFHEAGHHIQNVTKILPRVYSKIASTPKEKDKNRLNVMMELQADCYAGIAFHHIKKHLEPGDIEEVINGAARIGDDWIQRNSGTGRVMPDTFQHGYSHQRITWLVKGYKSGNMKDCDMPY